MLSMQKFQNKQGRRGWIKENTQENKLILFSNDYSIQVSLPFEDWLPCQQERSGGTYKNK